MRNSKKVCIWGLLACTFILCGMTKMQVRAENIVVMIDPGHGGENLGAKPEGYLEKNLTMVVAEAMYDRLNQYEGIDVYLTRNSDVDMSLQERAQAAADVQADFMFCLHFNMSDSHRLYGAETWIPAFDYYKQCYQFATLEMQQLTALGLYDRGIKTKLTKKEEDYYGIIREADTLNVPCVLIEHCHLDNSNDAGYYEDYEKLTVLGIADAEAVAKYYGLKSDVLGTNYTGFDASGILVPPSETTRDSTKPEVCQIDLKDYDKTTGEADLVLQASDTGSRMLYYDVSYDGGKTYSELFPLLYESSSISIVIPDETEPEIIVRAYNLYGAFSVSNSLILDKTQYPKPENEQNAIDKEGALQGESGSTLSNSEDSITTINPEELKTGNQELSKMQLFLLCIVMILLVLLSVFIANKLAIRARRKRARRRRRR